MATKSKYGKLMMTVRRYILMILCILICGTAFGGPEPQPVIKGKVNIGGVRVLLRRAGVETLTNADGTFEMSFPSSKLPEKREDGDKT